MTTDADGVSTGEGDPTAAFRYAYTTSMDDVYGKATQFMFSYRKDDGLRRDHRLHSGGLGERRHTAVQRLHGGTG